MILPSYYEFTCPVKTISGHKALEKIPEALASLNARRPMIITDKGVVQAGLIKVVKKAMGSKIKIGAIADNAPVDSDYHVVDQMAAIYRKKNCDAIIAVGGGSPIDTAKGVNAVASLGKETLLDVQGFGSIKQKLNPLVVIPTTSGTGSEVTNAAVIADPDRNIKMTLGSFFMLPNIAVLDPRMTKTLPPHLTSTTAMDAMTHACEAYTCLQKNPISDTTALAAIQLISQNVLKAVKNPKDMNARLALAAASNLAGMAFSNSLVGLVHNLGHATGAVCHVPHGTCMSIILPYGLEYNLHKTAALTGELLFALAGPKIYASTRKKERPGKAIQFIRDLNQKLYEATNGRHACSLNEIFGRKGEQLVPRDMIPAIAKTATYDGMKIMNPEEMSYDDNIMILEHAWEGIPLDLKKVKKGKKRIKF